MYYGGQEVALQFCVPIDLTFRSFIGWLWFCSLRHSSSLLQKVPKHRERGLHCIT